MIKVDEALKIILESVNKLEPEKVQIIDSLKRVLAEDVYSSCNIPAFDYSAMDGYALKFSDTKGASPESPRRLEVVGEFRAGGEYISKVGKGQVVKIMTGAPIPEGADAVIMVENTKEDGKDVAVFEEVEEGKNIRRTGEDIKKDDMVVREGTLLTAAHVGILASLGIPEVKVTRKPKAAILATGDEVIDIEEEIKPGKVRNSNAYSLNCQVLNAGGIPVNKGIAGDTMEKLKAKLRSCLDSDLILASGGVSMGEYDLVQDVMIELGMDVKFWKVAIRPGKPLLFGVIEGKPFWGLPGNPVSTMIVFEVFVMPALLKMLGQKADDRKEVEAVLEEDIKKKKGLKFFNRAVTRWEDGRYLTKTTGPQGSGILSSMILANSLMILHEDDVLIEKGSKVRVRFLS